MKNYMTVKEMIETLKRFKETDFVCVDGGESEHGSWGTIFIAEDMEDVIWGNGEVILEYEN